MATLTIRLAGVLAAALLFLGPALAAEAPVDRSILSYDENVTINTACFAASQQSKSAYDGCVRAQLAALKAHPSPDRTALSGAANHQIERDCSYQRRIGIGEYNECLKKAIATAARSDDPVDNPTGRTIANVFAAGPDRPPPNRAVVASLPLPSLVLSGLPSHIDRQPLSAADVFKKVERSVFVVYATPSLADAKARNITMGSAVAVAEHFLLTNCHVVKDRPVIRIMREEMEAVATLVASDPKADRCLLKSEGKALPPIAGVRLFKDLTIGERVFAIGTPRGLDRTLTQGIVSGLRNIEGRNLVQTDAPISHGNSGGGLFDESGNLIGITTLTLAVQPGYQNLNFAVAASDYWERK
jgi:S1-C subfamily serine protease